MGLTEKQIKEFNNMSLSMPELKRGILVGENAINLGDIINRALDNFEIVQFLKDELLAGTATTVISPVPNVLLGDFVVAIISSPNKTGAKAMFLSGVVTADEEITITPDVMPESSDGLFDVIVIRSDF